MNIITSTIFRIIVFLSFLFVAALPVKANTQETNKESNSQQHDNQPNKNYLQWADSLVRSGSERFRNNKFIEAISIFKKAVEVYKNLNIKEKQAASLHKIGNAYFMLGEKTNAIEHFYKAMYLYEDIGDSSGIAIAYNSIATINATQGNYETALDFYKKSLQIELALNNIANVAAIYNNIGNIHNDKKQHDKALEFYIKAYSLIDTTEQTSELARIIENIASQYAYLNLYNRAETFYYRALDIARHTNDKYLEAHVLANIADLNQKQKKMIQAVIYAQNSLTIAQTINAKKIIEINYLTLTKIYAQQCQSDSLQKYNELYLSIHDTIYSEYAAQKLAEMNVLYNSLKNEKEIAELKTENTLKAIKYQELIRLLWIISISGFLIIALGTLYFTLLRKKMKSDSVLVQKHIALSQIEEKIEQMSNENQAISEHKEEITQEQEDKNERYASSALSEEAKISLEYEITKLMKNERIFINSTLTINDIAKRLQTSRSYVSQAINEKMGKSFTQLVNEYRIKEAIKILSKPESSIYTIESIAQKVGFNSKSSFNTAFKNITGVTPSFFIKSLKK